MNKSLITSKLLFILIIVLTFYGCGSENGRQGSPKESRVTIFSDDSGMKLMIGNSDFMINGMNWDYFPIGTNFTYSLWEQPADVIKAALDYEMSLLKAAGINAIRQYTGIPAEWIEYIYHNYGIYTMLNHSFGRYGLMINEQWIDHTDYASEASREVIMNEITAMTEAYKNTDGLLLYLLGNENNYGLFWEDDETEDIPAHDEDAQKQARQMYRLFNEAAIRVKEMDKNHPVAICNGDVLFLEIIKEECKDIDIFGVNMYRGASFGDAFEHILTELNMPIMFTEFGADAFNAIYEVEDQKAQAYYVVENWREIYENAYGLGKAGNSIGGFTFQFSDGWWKYGQTKNLDIHDNNASWANGGYLSDYQSDGNNMNEEWFGVCAKGPANEEGLYQLFPRDAYFSLKEVHKLNPLEENMTLEKISSYFQSIEITKQKEMLKSAKIIVTSEAGDKMALKKNITFHEDTASGVSITIIPTQKKQTIEGIGSSFTEASAYVLAHLEPIKRKEVMNNIYGAEGANFSLARTHIGSCDFCVYGKYSYLDKEGDTQLTSFSLTPDKEGFSSDLHPMIMDESYDLLPMIKEALEIKERQEDPTLHIIASAWTAPAWMKDIEDWYIKGTAENNWQGTGGKLKKEYEETYADYLLKYIEAYKREGVDIWGITPVNEPHGNSGQWESMHFSPETQRDFIKTYLGPKIKNGKKEPVNILIFDQNRDGAEHWADVILGDEEAAKYVYGTAVHWYESTHKVYEDVFERVNTKFPEKGIIHTEGCIDDLGKPAPEGVGDPERFQEKDWFMNDTFWWNKNATDWGYTAPWPGVDPNEHPIYTPVHRYARNIIVSIDHWLKGWIDWNIVLDNNGGPNHVGNFCGAPIMIDTETKEIYYTPVYYILAQLSRSIRPGDRAVQTKTDLSGLDQDALHTCATINKDNLLSIQILNTTKTSLEIDLIIEGQVAAINLDANALQTIQIQL